MKLVGGSLITTTKPEYAEMDSYGPDDYEWLVKEGTKDVIENAQAALTGYPFRMPVVDLSGGKDSRLVFGAILNIPGWERGVRLNTKRIPGSEDAQIAVAIANHYGAEFYEGDDVQQLPLTLDDNLHFWRSYFFGQYNRFGAGAWSNKGLNHDALTLGGGIGELYRVFWGNVARGPLAQSSTSAEFASSLVAAAGQPYGASWDLGVVSAALRDELDMYHGQTLAEKIEDHYLMNRNRSHIGLRGFSSYHERQTWYPLASKHLYAASRIMPFEARANNQLIHDLMKQLDADLVRFRFDGEDPFSAVDAGHTTITPSEDLDRWEAAERVASGKLGKRRTSNAATMVWADLPPYVMQQTLNALDVLNATAGGLLPPDMADRVRAQFDASNAHGYQLAMRIFAVHDALLPSA